MLAKERLLPKNRKRIKSKGVSFEEYRDRPIAFAKSVLGIQYLTPDIRAVIESVRLNQVTNVQASHGAGKSHLAGAILIPWWVFAVKGLAITTAPTERQVKEILWSEVRRSYGLNKHKLGGRSGELFLKLDEDARAFGFTARSTDSNGFQGVHADRLLLIEDEACGIAPAIDEGAESCLVGSNNRMLRIGNPLADGTPFARACKDDHIAIAAWSHPNVSWAYQVESDGIHRLKPEYRDGILDENGKVRDRGSWSTEVLEAFRSHLERCGAIEIKGAISVEWIERMRAKHGEGSGFWESRIEARFPLDNEYSLIPRRYFVMARNAFDNADKDELALKLGHVKSRYGLDVGDGGDPHALARWQGNVLWEVRNKPTVGDELDSGRAVGLVAKQIGIHGKGAIAVDNVGVGAGALDALKRQGLHATGVRWGLAAKDTKRFANLKAEQWWGLREEMEAGQVLIAPLGENEDELAEDLAQTYYEETVKGQIKIEDKKKTRTRLGRSPNLGDSTVYGYHARPSINPLLLS